MTGGQVSLHFLSPDRMWRPSLLWNMTTCWGTMMSENTKLYKTVQVQKVGSRTTASPAHHLTFDPSDESPLTPVTSATGLCWTVQWFLTETCANANTRRTPVYGKPSRGHERFDARSVTPDSLNQVWANLLTCGPQRDPNFDRRAGPRFFFLALVQL